MKKQIFILIMAVFAATTAFGQWPSPRTVDVTCLPNDALHPMPGSPYNYIVNVPTPPGSKEYTWLVTQDQNFIVAPGTLTTNVELTTGNFLSATGTGYNDPATGTSTLSLTWKSFVYDAAKPVFVVIQVKSTVAGGCNPNNLKVFKIQPINAFTLDIANIAADKTTVSPFETNIDRCISPIVSAIYDLADDKVKTDFGTDDLYFVVAAANFTKEWLPSIQITGLDPKETITAVEWFRTADATFTTPGAMALSGTTYTASAPIPALDISGTVGTAGESIIIRVSIDHTNGANLYEGLTDEAISIAVDGKTQLGLATPLGDIHYSSTLPVANSDCGKEDGFKYDIANQVLKARPDINAATMPAPGLLSIKP